MRLPFDSSGCKFEEDARVKFLFSSPELHQNIEISLDGESTSVEALLDAFQRFLGALGINIPENTALGFIEIDEDEEDEDEIDDERFHGEIEEDFKKPNQKNTKPNKNGDDDENQPPQSNKNNKKK
jgi:hypothetical protein